MRTWLTDRFGLRVPVVGAPMAGAADGRLAAAISTAGALGMVGAGGTASPEWIRAQLAVAAAPGYAYGVGLMAWVQDEDQAQFDAVLEVAPPLVSVSFGDYGRYVAPLQHVGVTVATQVGTVQEAQEAEQAGVDVIVARGAEGGGHGRGEVGTLPLLQAVLEEVRTPVLAAGGIATARGLAAVLAAGAAGAWVGTAFLACEEATVTAAARRRLLDAEETDTVYGRVFDVGQRQSWPREYGGRSLRNAFFDQWHGREDALADDAAAQAALEAAREQGDFDTAVIYAGQATGLLRHHRPAAEVVAELGGAGELLRRAAAD
jgi:nitronate monooxygenase